MNDIDNKKATDIAIKNLERLIEFHRASIERWQNSEYSDNDIAKDIIEGFEKSIREIEGEIGAYKQYKETGVFVSRQARELLKKAKEERQTSESRKEEEGR